MPAPACTVARVPGDDERADRDAEIQIAGEVEIADRAGVDAAAIGLELGDDLHRAHLRRARHRARRETGDQRVEPILIVGELAFDDRDQVHDVRVLLEPHELRHAHGAELRHAAQVVAAEIDEHHVLGALFLVPLQLFGEPRVFLVGLARADACRRSDASAPCRLRRARASRATIRQSTPSPSAGNTCTATGSRGGARDRP